VAGGSVRRGKQLYLHCTKYNYTLQQSYTTLAPIQGYG
jgi:hypothetical protein